MSDFNQVGIRLMISVEQKVNLGNYESATVNMMLSNLPSWATDEDIDEALKTAKITFSKMADAIREQVNAKRQAAKDLAATTAPNPNGNERFAGRT